MRIEQKSPSRQTRMLCSLLGYSRQAYYKIIKTYETSHIEAAVLLTEVSNIRKDQKRLGGRKLFHKLQAFIDDHELHMGRDAFFDLLRDNGMLVHKRKRKHPKTTFSYHLFRKYPNRIIEFVPTGPNQLWVSDITYIRLVNKFAYLSLITDAYSRKIVGYYLCRTLEADGCVAALKMAIKGNPLRKQESEAMLHHSDRGIQYCSNEYVKLLNKHHIGISMTQSGDPLENALAERVNGILKDELLEDRYGLYADAQLQVSKAINLYNNERPHSSIDMLFPAEAHLRCGPLDKRWKNYHTFKKAKEVVMAE